MRSGRGSLARLGAWRPLVFVLALVPHAIGCDVTETGNPPLAAKMALTSHSSDATAIAIAPATGPRFTVDAAWVVIGDIRFVRAAVCDLPGETEIDVPGPVVRDLAPAPFPIDFTIAGDDYCRVRVPIIRAQMSLPAGAPPELLDASVVVLGRRADGRTMLVRSRRMLEVDTRSRGAPFSLREAEPAVLLSFDVARWLAGVDIDAAAVGGDGRVVVDDSQNRAQLDAFEANVEAAVGLYRDRDLDSRLDADELFSPLASGGP